MDGRQNNGGARPNAGRKRKAKHELAVRLGMDAIKTTYGSLEDYFNFIAEESKDSYQHLKLLQEYVFGKPKEVIQISDEDDDDGIDYSKLSDSALKEITELEQSES